MDGEGSIRCRGRGWRTAVALGTLMLALLVAAGCGGSSEDKQSGTSTTQSGSSGSGAGAPAKLTWAMSSPLNSLDLAKGWSLPLINTSGLAFEGLMRITPQGTLEPALATEAEQVDPTTYVYTLRDGVTFWDGKPLTAADVVFSLQRQADAKGGSIAAGFFGSFKSAKADDTSHVTVRLKAPDPLWQYQVAHASAFIYERAYALAHADDLGSAEAMNMGTGPYKFTTFKPGASLTLERNGAYWDPKPGPGTITLTTIPDPSAQVLALRSGEIDGAFGVAPDQVDQWTAAGATAQWVVSQGFFSLFFNSRAAPFDDVHVRRAIAYATDKASMAQTLVRGRGRPASTFLPPDSWKGLGVSQELVDQAFADTPGYEFDIDKAKQELAASGHPDGFSATLTYPDSQPLIGKAGQILAESLKPLNITLKLSEIPYAKWVTRTIGNDKDGLSFEAIRFVPDYPDPANGFSQFANSAFATAGGLNMANYKNPKVDRLLAQQATESDATKRAEMLAEIQRLVADDAAYLPLWWDDVSVVTRKGLTYRDWNAYYSYQPWADSIVEQKG